MRLDSAGSGGSVEGKPAESDSGKMLLLWTDFTGMTPSMTEVWMMMEEEEVMGGGG